MQRQDSKEVTVHVQTLWGVSMPQVTQRPLGGVPMSQVTWSV